MLLPLFKGDVVFPDLERHFQLPSSVRPCLGVTRNVSVFLRHRKEKVKPPNYLSIFQFSLEAKRGSYMKI